MKYSNIKMEDALEALIDYRGKTPAKSKTGIQTLSAKSVKNGYIDYSQCYYISQEEYERFMVRGLPQIGDILLTTEAPMGLVARLDRDDVAIAQRLLTLRGKNNVLDNHYLMYYLQSPKGQAALKARETGTTVTGIKQAEFRKIELDLPEYDYQVKVSGIIRALDERIAVNNAINNNLQQQIEALFNFQYTPNLCRSYWRIGAIGDVVTLQRGYDLPKDKIVHGLYPVAGSTDTIFYHYDYTTEPPCIVMGRSGNIGKPRLYMEKCWAHNTTLFVKDFKGNNPYWAYYMLRTIDYSQFQGGSAVPTLNRNHVHSFEVAIPPIEVQNEFAKQILPSLQLIENNRMENRNLAALRDTILPKLMSGELDVSEVQI